MAEKILDISKLHNKSDKDPKSLILASGRNLQLELRKIRKELNNRHNNIQVINFIANRNNININIRNNEINLGTEIIKIIQSKSITKTKSAKLIKISSEDFNKILKNKHVPSCKKIGRIEKYLGHLNNITTYCNKNNFCLKKLILIHKAIFLNPPEIPLFIIKDLLYLWKKSLNINEKFFVYRKNRILKSIEYLRCNQFYSERIRCCNNLNKNLAKIIGAFCADGCLSKSHMIGWEEEHLSNLIALTKWIKSCFKEVTIEPERRGRNSYVIRFRSKIISRYIITFFKINPGKKTHIIRIPRIIRMSNFNIRKAFAVGVMTFEAGANSDGSISLYVCSKKFRDDVAKILKEDQLAINQSITNRKKLKTQMYGIVTNKNTDQIQKRKFKHYFEKQTIKWLKMIEFEKGFSDKVKSQQQAINNLEIFFYKNSKINIYKIFAACRKLKRFDIYDVIKETKYPRGTLTKYLSIICKTNIIVKTRSNRSKYYFNNNVANWRTPSIKFYHTLKI